MIERSLIPIFRRLMYFAESRFCASFWRHTPVRNQIVDALRPLGALGVHMFFAMSGFLITYRFIEEQEQTGPSISARSTGGACAGFFLRRSFISRCCDPGALAALLPAK